MSYREVVLMFKFKLKELLEERDRNQRSLKLETGIRSGTNTAYYHGFVKRMNVADLIKICDALDCSLDKLLEYAPKKNKIDKPI